jgi:hypothetical protein
MDEREVGAAFDVFRPFVVVLVLEFGMSVRENP